MPATFYFTVLAVITAVDLYVYKSYRFMVAGQYQQNLILLYWICSLIIYGTLLGFFTSDYHKWPGLLRVSLLAFSQAIILSKIVVVPFLLLDDLQRIIQVVWHTVRPKDAITHGGQIISRAKFLHTGGWLLAGILFANIAWGVTRTAYNYTIRRVNFKWPHLPLSFSGLKIVQISDLHLGSFANTAPVEKMVKMVNEQAPDIIIFTGDLVNNFAYEAIPFKDVLSGFKARLGVFSILGNHDYGEYTEWKKEEDKVKNHSDLIAFQAECGWKLLRNENIVLQNPDGKLAILGVEDWGTHFYKFGDVRKAMHGAEDADVKILLSHDPSHWDEIVSKEWKDISLTLSGHTHGFQFGVEIPEWHIKLGAGQAIYPHWAGLYKEGDQHLYVNRGAGFIGFPGRVGITPEITVFTLETV